MPRRWILVSLIAACATTEEGEDTDSPQLDSKSQAIVGGEQAESGQWPDAVAVLGSSGTCTGTLIAPNVVLTAGHCEGIKPVQVVANTIDYAQDGGTRAHVAKTIAYPNWQTSYDVAVLVLASPIAGVAPRKIGTSCTFKNFDVATPVRLVGFGATDMQGDVANSSLKQAMTEVTDPDCMGGNGCKKVLAPGGEFVAGGTGAADSCFGDSGGPVYLDTPNGPVVIGAVSRGVDNSDTPCGGGGIYVRTDKLVDWIEQVTETAVEQDECEGVAYSGEETLDDQPEEVGCSATRGGGLGSLVLLLGALFAVRRRR